MDKDIKDLEIMGAIIIVLTILLGGIYCIGYTYGERAEHAKTRELVLKNMSLRNEIDIYKTYYKNTEALLDTLNQYYDWVDAYDPQDYYESVLMIEPCTD